MYGAAEQTAELNGIQHSEQCVRVSMFGGLSVTFGVKTITDSLNRSSRIWNLLSYILLNRGRELPRQELIDAVWPEENTNNPASTLKTLVYRARCVLNDEFGISMILSGRSTYSWNPEVSCKLDTEEFERLCNKATDEKLSQNVRISLYLRAIELYKGDFLPKLRGCDWINKKAFAFSDMRHSAIKNCARLMTLSERYSEAVKLCGKAVADYPSDEELHTYLILAHARLGNDSEAISQYEAATDFLYRGLGVVPSAQLRNAYLEIMKDKQSLETDLYVIQNALREQDDVTGAFVCDFNFFREICRLESRRAMRLGYTVHLALLTINNAKGNIPPPSIRGRVMENLLDVIKSSLRKGDVVARYSSAQFIIMLSATTFENGEMVIKRIVSAYLNKYPNNMKVSWKLQQLEGLK